MYATILESTIILWDTGNMEKQGSSTSLTALPFPGEGPLYVTDKYLAKLPLNKKRTKYRMYEIWTDLREAFGVSIYLLFL